MKKGIAIFILVTALFVLGSTVAFAERQVEVVFRGGEALEGPSIDREGTLYVTNWGSGWISKIHPDGTRENVVNTGGSPRGTKFHKDGRLFIADRDKGVLFWDPRTGKLETLFTGYEGKKFLGVNDLIFDSQGNFYFTDPWTTGAHNPTGAVYKATAHGELVQLINNMAFPNGIALSPDESMLCIAEMAANRIWYCTFDKKGKPEWVGILCNLSGGIGPDGMAVDAKGNLYVAREGCGGVQVISPMGDLLELIKVPEGIWTSNCCFGGPDNQDLYITEESVNVIYKVRMDNPGLTLFSHK